MRVPLTCKPRALPTRSSLVGPPLPHQGGPFTGGSALGRACRDGWPGARGPGGRVRPHGGGGEGAGGRARSSLVGSSTLPALVTEVIRRKCPLGEGTSKVATVTPGRRAFSQGRRPSSLRGVERHGGGRPARCSLRWGGRGGGGAPFPWPLCVGIGPSCGGSGGRPASLVPLHETGLRRIQANAVVRLKTFQRGLSVSAPWLAH